MASELEKNLESLGAFDTNSVDSFGDAIAESIKMGAARFAENQLPYSLASTISQPTQDSRESLSRYAEAKATNLNNYQPFDNPLANIAANAAAQLPGRLLQTAGIVTGLGNKELAKMGSAAISKLGSYIPSVQKFVGPAVEYANKYGEAAIDTMSDIAKPLQTAAARFLGKKAGETSMRLGMERSGEVASKTASKGLSTGLKLSKELSAQQAMANQIAQVPYQPKPVKVPSYFPTSEQLIMRGIPNRPQGFINSFGTTQNQPTGNNTIAMAYNNLLR